MIAHNTYKLGLGFSRLTASENVKSTLFLQDIKKNQVVVPLINNTQKEVVNSMWLIKIPSLSVSKE